MTATMSSDIGISLVWLVLTALFFKMAWKEHTSSKQPLGSLRSVLDPDPDVGLHSYGGLDPVPFARELEKHRHETHQLAARGYIGAAIAALASFVVSLIQAFGS